MATTPGTIRWRDSDIEALKRELDKYNRKIRRLQKQGVPEVVRSLPPKMTLKQAKANISYRSEYNNLMKSLKRFTKRGSQKLVKTRSGVVTTKYEVEDLNARVRSINARRAREAAKMPKEAWEMFDKPRMGRMKDQALKPKQYAGAVSPEDWDAYRRSVMKQSQPGYERQRMELYKRNYYQSLDNIFDDEEAAFYKELFDEMPIEKFVELSLNDEILYIGFSSKDPLPIQEKRELIRDEINAQWRTINNLE